MTPTPVPPEPLHALASGTWVRQMLHGATALGLVERLAAGDQELEELAETCGTDAESLLRLLRGLASLGLCEETAPRRFAPTPMAALLRHGPSGARPRFTRLLDEEQPQHWETWLHCLRNGETAFRHRHGCSVVAWYRRHPQRPPSLSPGISSSRVPT